MGGMILYYTEKVNNSLTIDCIVSKETTLIILALALPTLFHML